MFGGDEVSAIVVDLGTSSIKAGWAGEDTPRCVLPAWYGHVPDSEDGDSRTPGLDSDAQMGETAEGAEEEPTLDGPTVRRLPKRSQVVNGRRLLYGDNALSRPHVHGKPVAVSSLFAPDGTARIADTDASEGLWWHLYANCMFAHPEHHPLLVSERLVADLSAGMAARESLTELLFEKLRVPALYAAKAPVLTAFAVGRPTALVLDVGAKETTATAVHDGFALHKSLQSSSLAGDALTSILRFRFERRTPPTILRPIWSLQADFKGEADPSMCEYALAKLAEDAKISACAVSESALSATGVPDTPLALAGVSAAVVGGLGVSGPAGLAMHELPFRQGNVDMTAERFELAELLLQPNPKLGCSYAHSDEISVPAAPPGSVMNGGPSRSAAVQGYPLPNNARALTELVTAAIAASDPDIRRELYSGIVLSGGCSLFPGLAERLQAELALAVPQMLSLKVKVLTGTTSAERQHASWIGGSILGSLGSFQQLWMSRAEYEEEGPSSIHRKCP
mmetsp:Transcript_45973/g.107350  ORF Transcript_45973/g.107350 Transcript_45973/m.107350 type:complete len:508 (+) Transcript_45973:93-1616(+)